MSAIHNKTKMDGECMYVREFVFACILVVVLCHLALVFDDSIFGIVLIVLLVNFGFIAPWAMLDMMLVYDSNDVTLSGPLYLLLTLIVVVAVAFISKKHALRNVIIAECLVASIFIAITYPHFDEKVFTERNIPYVTEESSDWI